MFADSSLSVVFANGTVEFANKTPAFANSWEVGTVCRPVDESANSWRSQTRANIYIALFLEGGQKKKIDARVFRRNNLV